VSGRKLVGSAQRRQGGAFLQHGSVLLDADIDRLRAVFPGADPGAGITTLLTLLGRAPGFDTVSEALASGLAEALGCRLVAGGLSDEEAREAEALVAGKYAHPEWIRTGVAAAPSGMDPVALCGAGARGDGPAPGGP